MMVWLSSSLSREAALSLSRREKSLGCPWRQERAVLRLRSLCRAACLSLVGEKWSSVWWREGWRWGSVSRTEK